MLRLLRLRGPHHRHRHASQGDEGRRRPSARRLPLPRIAKKLAEKNKAAAAKAKAAAAAEKKRKEEARKANKARYNAMNKTVGGSSKLIKKSAPPNIKDPFANRKKDDKPRKKFLGIF